jgi:hypothetical protein
LRQSSIGARGLWIEMMTLMHEGEPYGHLTVQGRPIDLPMLARLCGETPTILRKLLKELSENEVFSTTECGVIFSRRMVKDEAVRESRAAGGNAGKSYGSRGAEHGVKGGRPKNKITPLGDDERGVSDPPPSSSSSTSSPSSEPIGSIPLSNDNGAIDPEKVMFDAGVALITAAGKSEGTARAWLGKAKKSYGSAAVIAALGTAKREGAIDPIPFLEASLRARARSPTLEMGPC